MTSIRIFLASSNELVDDRKAFKEFLYDKSRIWTEQRGIFLEMVNWEEFIDALSASRLQNEYNEAIRKADVFVMLFWTKVGMYTNEEFDTALEAFRVNGRPRIYTYFKDAPSDTPVQDSLQTFKDKLNKLGHFETRYTTTTDLKQHFGDQLERLFPVNGGGNGRQSTVPHTSANGKATKEELLDHVDNDEIPIAIDKMNEVYLRKNITLNALSREYVNRPANFDIVSYSNRLKLFISLNWR